MPSGARWPPLRAAAANLPGVLLHKPWLVRPVNHHWPLLHHGQVISLICILPPPSACPSFPYTAHRNARRGPTPQGGVYPSAAGATLCYTRRVTPTTARVCHLARRVHRPAHARTPTRLGGDTPAGLLAEGAVRHRGGVSAPAARVRRPAAGRPFALRDAGFHSPFALLVAALLSARTRDETLLRVVPPLLARAPTPGRCWTCRRRR